MISQCLEGARFTCDWIFNILVVLCDGKVVCGCADPYGERPVGDLSRNSIKEIWNSSLVQDIRQGLNQGHSCFCHHCGLKRLIAPGERIDERPVNQERLPRIFFEPTILCNLSCFESVCNHQSGIVQTRKRSQYPLADFKSLFQEVGRELIRVDFFNYGEPFIHPQAIDMIEHIKENYRHIFLYTSTNGLMLDEEKIRRLVRSGMEEITFSVDGADDKTYNRYRQGGDFNRLLQIMRYFVKERNQMGREVPFINWRYILFRWNDSAGQMNKARKLATEIGVDRLVWEITDHPKSALSNKYQMGTRVWKKIYYEIWDSSHVGNAITKKRLLAWIKVVEKKLQAHHGTPIKVKVQVKNTGGAKWWHQTYSGRWLVRLGAQLYDRDKNLIELNYARQFLPRSLFYKDKADIVIELGPIESLGNYWLKFDLVSEGADWFENGGSRVVWRPFKVY